MELTIENIENPIRLFAEQISLLESYINDIICIEDPEARLVGSEDDFPLLNELVDHAYLEDTPKDVRKIMLQGIIYAFSEVLTNEHGMQWCHVKDGPFPGLAMRKGDDLKVVYLFSMLERYMAEAEEIELENVYREIEGMLNDSDS